MPENLDGYQHNANHQSSHLNAAQQAFRDHDFEKSIIEYKKTILEHNEPSYHGGLAQAYERKGLRDKEIVFITLAWNEYVYAFNKQQYTNDILDGLVRTATKLTLFDELVNVVTGARKTQPENTLLETYLKKISTISLMSIPQVEKSDSKTSSWILKILFGVVLPFSGIMLFILGFFISRYYPESLVGRFSGILKISGVSLFLAYLAFILLKTPSSAKRKNW